MKSGANWSSGFRKEDVKAFMILYLYIAQGQDQITRGQNSILTKSFTALIKHLKFQPLVLNTY